VLGASGVVAPIVFAATVSSGSWAFAFALAGVVTVAGWWLLGALSAQRHTATP
jgi:hypothetical protein